MTTFHTAEWKLAGNGRWLAQVPPGGGPCSRAGADRSPQGLITKM